jgi:GntR family transcriptional regulator, transcriptional repressor for pyruvate dehydrogenase complex
MKRLTEPVSLSFETVRPRKNLVGTLTEAIERGIADGRLKPGDRLPPQEEMAESAGVSRTVVREALASLRAAGMITTRQGAGAFVTPQKMRVPLKHRVEPATLENILGVLEVRMAVEVESAALAAVRRTEEDIANLDAAIAALANERAAEGDGVEPDLEFHAALAAATQNPQFPRFLDYLGELAMPRRHLPAAAVSGSNLVGHLEMIESEHRIIRDAVAAHDSSLAAASMRGHIAGSRKRYSLLREADGRP